MQRRDFITLLGGAAAAWPVAARAQQVAPVIGVLDSGGVFNEFKEFFHRGLNEQGFVESRNFSTYIRDAFGEPNRLPALAADLVNRKVAVIVALGAALAPQAAQAATSTIPIVFAIGGDPVEIGLVPSLARPNGNLTGITNASSLMASKQLGVLHALTTATSPIGVLVNRANPVASGFVMRDVEPAGRAIGRRILLLDGSTEPAIDAAFETLVHERAGALLVGPDAYFRIRKSQIIALAARHAIPTLYFTRDFVQGGGLMSYSANRNEGFRVVGNYTGRILKGEKPADLPVQQPTKFEFVINLKTAKALGIEVPPTMSAQADEIIE
jgi:putative tryptophan/tyrosine transport system substrate-binding protein